MRLIQSMTSATRTADPLFSRTESETIFGLPATLFRFRKGLKPKETKRRPLEHTGSGRVLLLWSTLAETKGASLDELQARITHFVHY